MTIFTPNTLLRNEKVEIKGQKNLMRYFMLCRKISSSSISKKYLNFQAKKLKSEFHSLYSKLYLNFRAKNTNIALENTFWFFLLKSGGFWEYEFSRQILTQWICPKQTLNFRAKIKQLLHEILIEQFSIIQRWIWIFTHNSIFSHQHSIMFYQLPNISF